MKKIISIFAVVLSTIGCSNAQKNEFSKETLQYQLTTTDQSKVTFQSILDANKGKKIVIEIWAGWCGDCVKAMPRVKELQAKFSDVSYVFISMDKSFEKWAEATKKHDLSGSLYWVNDPKMMKGEFGQSINLDWIPRYIVVNEKGQIILYRAIETEFDKIETALKN